MNKIKGFKTVVFGALTAALALLSTPGIAAWVAEYLPFVGTAFGIAVVWLRYLTNSPMFRKE
jgi:hypothetical protein